jgi:hypothetical protein
MFAEEVILSALKAQDSWFVSDYLLVHENRGINAEAVAKQIADDNELRLERVERGRPGYRFWRME